MLVNAESLAAHLDGPKLNRGTFLPFLPEVLENPYEIWVKVLRNPLTGQVAVRKFFVKTVKTADKKRDGFTLVAESSGGVFVGWTFIPMKKAKDVNKNRWGLLTYARLQEEE